MNKILFNFAGYISPKHKYQTVAEVVIKRNYAVDSKKIGTSLKRMEYPLEKDTNRLANYVCGTNFLKEGGEDIKLKPENEYPDWLWNINFGLVKNLEDLDPNTKEYWLRVRELNIRRNNKMHQMKSKYIKSY